MYQKVQSVTRHDVTKVENFDKKCLLVRKVHLNKFASVLDQTPQ
jgi:hypothetical protein